MPYSQCLGLKIVGDLRPKLFDTPYLADDRKCHTLQRKLQDEQERHSATRSLFEKASLQLQSCRKDLDKAEEERTEALAYCTEAEALREKLSAKEQEMLDLSEELSRRKGVLGLQDRLRERSIHNDAKNCSTMLPKGLSCAQEVIDVSQREGIPPPQHLDARQEAEKVYETKLTDLCLKIQSLEQELEVANRNRIEVEEALEFEISHCKLHHIDVALLSSEKTEQMDDGDCPVDNAGLQSHSHAPACPQSDGVAIPDAIEPEQVSPQAVGQQSNDIPHLITASPKIMPQQVGLHLEIVGDVMAGHPSDNVFVPDVEAAHQAASPSGYFPSSNTVGQQPNDIAGPNTDDPEIVPQQVDPDLDTVGDNGSTGFVQHHTESLQLDGAVASHPSGIASVLDVNDAKAAQHEAAHQHSDADGAQVAPPFDISSSSPLDTSERYTRSNRKLIFILSTVVAHQIAQLRLIFHAVLSQTSPPSPDVVTYPLHILLNATGTQVTHGVTGASLVTKTSPPLGDRGCEQDFLLRQLEISRPLNVVFGDLIALTLATFPDYTNGRKLDSSLLHRSFITTSTMPLNKIVLGSLYASRPLKRAFVMNRIRVHYDLKCLEKSRVEIAKVRPIEWHGESGAAKEGGHLTVDFLAPDWSHVVTQHVYSSSEAYGSDGAEVVSAEETEAFNLKGDVQQLLPVVVETTCAAALVTYRSIPGAIVIVTGFLQYIDKESKTFCVQLHQHIEGGTAEDGLTIVTETNTSSEWAGFVQQVPHQNGDRKTFIIDPSVI
ncbi:hypothetical protein EDB85DRAFT_2287346 [Lactarius pseudohatsudake]|nr:hypothetical protein EDB85DRAFT_2287346 [Lactarius pseudohatsudake]